MADQQAGWEEAIKWLGGLAAGFGGIRAYYKARNTNHADRIARLERQRREDESTMQAVKSEIEELKDRMDIALASTNRRVLTMETNMRDTEREIRDSLQSIVETLNRRLHGEPVTRQQPEPRAER